MSADACLHDSPSTTVLPRPRHRGVWADKLADEIDPDVSWLWEGYLARGDVTLLTSQWRVGKTTLISVLLHRLAAGGLLAGRPVAAARAAVLSEESPRHWSRRCQQFGVWRHVCFFCRPLSGQPTLAQWRELIDDFWHLRQAEGIDLFVIDPLSAFLPRGSENLVSGVLEALRSLERLTADGAAVLLLHHPKKGDVLAGQAARGSGAMSAYCDVLMELYWAVRDNRDDRRRRLCAWSRHDDTPAECVIELTPDGRDYLVVDDPGDERTREGWDLLHLVLHEASEQLTRKQILDKWPAHRPPNEATLWRWLQLAVQRRQVLQLGAGLKNDPFRYQLPDRDLPYWPDPFESLGL